MSTTQNHEWLETKYEVFRFACENEDWDLGQEVVNDLFEKGFGSEAVELGKELLTKKMSVNEYE